MFVLYRFLIALAQGIDVAFTFYYWLIIIRVIVSWVNPDPYNQLVQFLYRATDPVLGRIRRLLPVMPIDLSPIIAIFLISILKSFLVGIIFDIANRLQ